MISRATPSDRAQIKNITERAGVFNQHEIDSVSQLFDDYVKMCRESDQILEYSIFGWPDLTDGVCDLYWISDDPDARPNGVGCALGRSVLLKQS